VTCLGLRTDTHSDHDCKDAHGVRAGASITVRGRFCAERSPAMTDGERVERLRRATESLRRATELSRLDLRARMLDRLDEDDPEWADFLREHPELGDAS
jgi:hypothetical protein